MACRRLHTDPLEIAASDCFGNKQISCYGLLRFPFLLNRIAGGAALSFRGTRDDTALAKADKRYRRVVCAVSSACSKDQDGTMAMPVSRGPEGRVEEVQYISNIAGNLEYRNI